MVIVGDDNQSIYLGRGASPVGLRELYTSPVVDQVSLQRCRRCRANILSAANTFLASFQQRVQPLIAYEDGGEVGCYSLKSTKAELAFLVGRVRESLQRLPLNPAPKEAIVCLFPTRKALACYYNALCSTIPCFTKKTQPNPDRAALAECLQLVCHPHQRFAERLLLERFQAVKPRHKRLMVARVISEDVSPSRAVGMLSDSCELSGLALDAARSFAQTCQALSSRDTGTISRALSPLLGNDEGLLRESIEELLLTIRDTEQEEAISALCDRVLPASAQPADDPHAVQFLTMHASKGLTRREVFLPGFEDAWLPGECAGGRA